jgi:hypothetical protein
MSGEGMGFLNVFVNETNSGVIRPIFTKQGSQGDEWNNGNATIRSKGRYQVT